MRLTDGQSSQNSGNLVMGAGIITGKRHERIFERLETFYILT